MRNIQGNAAQMSGYEVWDVTDVKKPVLASALRGIRSTHKLWWECNTGIAYMPGQQRRHVRLPLWRQSQSMVIVDWSNPARSSESTSALTVWSGGQPGATGPVPTSLHGAISAHEHPNAADKLARGQRRQHHREPRLRGMGRWRRWRDDDSGPEEALTPLSLVAVHTRATLTNPPKLTCWLRKPGSFTCRPDQGGHTSMPVFGLAPTSLQCSSTAYPGVPSPDMRDIVLLASEAGNCNSQHWSFIVDVTDGKLDRRAAEPVAGADGAVDAVGRSAFG